MDQTNSIVQRLRAELVCHDSEPESESQQAVLRLRMAFQMANSGLEMMRQNLRREHPDASDDAIHELLKNWLDGRYDDSWGRLVTERLQQP